MRPGETKRLGRRWRIRGGGQREREEEWWAEGCERKKKAIPTHQHHKELNTWKLHRCEVLLRKRTV